MGPVLLLSSKVTILDFSDLWATALSEWFNDIPSMDHEGSKSLSWGRSRLAQQDHMPFGPRVDLWPRKRLVFSQAQVNIMRRGWGGGG